MPDVKKETIREANATTICPVCNIPLIYAPENLIDRKTYYYCNNCDWYREETEEEKDRK